MTRRIDRERPDGIREALAVLREELTEITDEIARLERLESARRGLARIDRDHPEGSPR